MTYDNFDYQLLAAQAEAIGLSLADTHGQVCGMLCGHLPGFEQQWQQRIFADLENDDAPDASFIQDLQQLVEHTAAQLVSGDGVLTLALPTDDQPLAERALALSDWCTGFLYGFGLAGEQSAEMMSEEAGEALRDFAEISRLNVAEIDEQDAEEALVQLEEYLWVAALLIWHAADKGDKTT